MFENIATPAEQAALNLMIDIPADDTELSGKGVKKTDKLTLREERGMTEQEWNREQQGINRYSIAIHRDLERRGLTTGKPLMGREISPDRIFV